MNNRYTIKISSPLLRPGIVIETEVSERYVVPALRRMMEHVREFNDGGVNFRYVHYGSIQSGGKDGPTPTEEK